MTAALSTSRRDGATRRHAPVRLLAQRARILVGVSLDRASAVALKRARFLARSLRLELRVVHVAEPSARAARRGAGAAGSPERVEVTRGAGRAFAKAAAPRGRSSRGRERLLQCAVQQWAEFELGVSLATDDILIYFGQPAEALDRAAREHNAELLVIGGTSGHDSAPPGWVTQSILAEASCPTLITAPKRSGRSLVVGTDLDSPNVPVVRAAVRLASRMKRRVTVVHNIDGVGFHGAVSAVPDSWTDEVVATRLEALGCVVRDLASVEEATITRQPTAVDGILQVARARDVDLVVVGVRPDVGDTSRLLLSETRRSVLAVPLAS